MMATSCGFESRPGYYIGSLQEDKRFTRGRSLHRLIGKYQLLSLILLIILAGLVMVMGIHLSSSDARETGLNAIQSDLERIAELAQEFYRKPIMLGGGGNSFDGSGRTFGSPIE